MYAYDCVSVCTCEIQWEEGSNNQFMTVKLTPWHIPDVYDAQVDMETIRCYNLWER